MKGWRATTRASKVQQRRSTITLNLQDQTLISKAKPTPTIHQTQQHSQIRPGTRLRHQLKHFSKVTKERINHFDLTNSSNGNHKTSMDKREARRIGREALSSVELFHNLNINKLSEKLKYTAFRSGEILIEQNTVGQLLYVVLEGTVAIYVNQKQVSTKDVGTILGERAMLFDQLTSAKCVALTPVRCAFITRTSFLDTLPDGAEENLL